MRDYGTKWLGGDGADMEIPDQAASGA